MLGSSPTPRVATNLRALAAAAGLYAILAVIATWPLLIHFYDQVPGSDLWRSQTIHAESLLSLWNLWWFRHAVADLGLNPFDCRFFLYPYGVSLAEIPGEFAVLELPFGVRDGRGALGWPDNRQIFAQTVHGHPIVAAAVSRLPPEKWRVIGETPVVVHPSPLGSALQAIVEDALTVRRRERFADGSQLLWLTGP